jgi:hypothetical protein
MRFVYESERSKQTARLKSARRQRFNARRKRFEHLMVQWTKRTVHPKH